MIKNAKTSIQSAMPSITKEKKKAPDTYPNALYAPLGSPKHPNRRSRNGLAHSGTRVMHTDVSHLHMFNRTFWEQLVQASPPPLLLLPLQIGLERRTDDVVEEEGAVNKHDKTEHLQPLESLPSEAERDDPNEKGAARVDGCTRRSRDSARNGKTKEVESTGEKVNNARNGKTIDELTRC